MGVTLSYSGLGGKLKFSGTTGRFKTVYMKPLLLNLYPGAAAAYSLRKLSSTYIGSAIRVRRSSDNTETDIGFNSSDGLDTSSLSTFCGVGNGFVTTWYDQSGNAKNATQTTTTYQPQIVTSGVIETQLSKPAIKFLAQVYNGFITTLNVTNPFSIIGVVSQDLSYTGARIYQAVANNSLIAIKRADNLSVYTGATVVSNFPSQISNQCYLLSFLRQTSTSYVYQNNLAVTNSSTSTSDWGTFTFSGQGQWGGEAFLGKISETIIYSSNKNSDISGIHSSVNSYYSIY